MYRLRLLAALLLSFVALASAGRAQQVNPREQVKYGAESHKTFKGPDDYFTGDVQVEMLFPANETAHYSGAYVTFQPGARTAWHYHPAGQHMIVTSGVGLTGTRDGKIVEFQEGDTVWCPPDIDHWHGATPDAPMTHLVITGDLDGKNVIWKEKVTDEQYLGKAQKKSEDSTMSEVTELSKKQQAIIPIAAFTASGDLEKLKFAMNEGLDAGLTVNEVKEIPIHLYAYAGFPRALNSLGTLMAVLAERRERGITDTIGKDASPLPTDKSSVELGKTVQTHLVGRPVSGPLFDFAPVINEYLQGHLFGDIFGRDVLDYQEREVATVAALANMDGVESQLKAHLAISMNVGLTPEQLRELVSVFEAKVSTKNGQRTAASLGTLLDAKKD